MRHDGATVQYGPAPALNCASPPTVGAVRITSVNGDAGLYQAAFCGIYDLDCTNGTSGHRLHVQSTFDSLVSTGTGPGR